MLDKSNHCKANSKGRKPNKIWVDKDSEFYYRSMKSWLQENDIEIYLLFLKDLLERSTAKFISI